MGGSPSDKEVKKNKIWGGGETGRKVVPIANKGKPKVSTC